MSDDDGVVEGKDPEIVEKDETEGGLGNLFGGGLKAPKTALEEAKEAAAKAKKAAEGERHKLFINSAIQNLTQTKTQTKRWGNSARQRRLMNLACLSFTAR